jgi:uncharacterized protein with HEPN domain
MLRDYRAFLNDILAAIGDISDFTAGLSLPTFAADKKTFQAALRSLEIIGEAVKNVPEALRAKHGKVDWKLFAGLRDVLIHRYFRVDPEIIWDVIQNKLPILENQILQMMDKR